MGRRAAEKGQIPFGEKPAKKGRSKEKEKKLIREGKRKGTRG
jgi:hypothetical protein